MENCLQPGVSLSFLPYLPDDCCFAKKLHETQVCRQYFMNYLYIYIYLLCNSSILDIQYSPYYIALGSTLTHKVI